MKGALALFLLAAAWPSSSLLAQGYDIKVTFKPYTRGFIYLAHYFGKPVYVKDSLPLGPGSTVEFKGREPLEGGIYMVVNPAKNQMVEMLIDSGSAKQHFSVVADSADLVHGTHFTGSPDNDVFSSYQAYAAGQYTRMRPLQQALSTAKTHADSTRLIDQIQSINKATADYRTNLMKVNPSSFLATLFALMQEPVIPPAPKLSNGRPDSLFAYRYYKAHYWDGIAFNDGRLLFTPIFEPKLNDYFTRLVSPEPDSLKEEVNYMILYSRSDPTMFKYFITKFTNDYATPKYMGQDAVFLDLFEKYYQTGQVDWLTDAQKKAIYDRAYSIMANQLGDPAADMSLLDTADRKLSLYSVQAPFTVVCFWDPDCGHCQKIVPELDSIYVAKWKQLGVKVWAVLIDTVKTDVAKIAPEKAHWMKYIRDHHLDDWLNVYQTPAMKQEDIDAKRAGFRQLYDVYQTPTIYLLDEQKKIVGKKLTWEQVDELIQRKMQRAHTTNPVSR
ncbi:AhpC/TSA family protein [Dinghuibacter silviterrae]|uniref:AhpC/TSA family protein n=2 Tax=Dinghuibacter silviterrae TaxID=1539049 RepID=A0A4V6Q9Y4_9BACT|nr:AhpC/TSA family protein [Dinghuibacter silviterrae]